MEENSSHYSIDTIHKQGGHPVANHSETLFDAKWNYRTYKKEFYGLVQSMKQWWYYILEKEKIFHIDHHPLSFIDSQTKIHEERHLKWVAYIQIFHLEIKYNKGTSNWMDDLLSWPPT